MSINPRYKYTDVVVAVIIRAYTTESERILLIQRPGDKSYPWTWECAGGKVETGERHLVALRRELREELDLQEEGVDLPGGLAAATFLGDFRFVPPTVHRPLHLHYYRVETRKTWVPQVLAGVGCGWFTLSEAEKLTLAPGNQMLRTLMSGGPR